MSSFESRKADRHGWNSLESYLAIHDAQLRRLGDYFVDQNGLEVSLTQQNRLLIEGRLLCKGGIFIDVTKHLEINDRHQVRTLRYKYHAGLDGSENRPILRYDNSHTYQREGHPDPHHKHCFDHLNWQEILPPLWIGEEHWPTLSDVLDELYEWYLQMRERLELPD